MNLDHKERIERVADSVMFRRNTELAEYNRDFLNFLINGAEFVAGVTRLRSEEEVRVLKEDQDREAAMKAALEERNASTEDDVHGAPV